jgi:hypothetical protein
MAEKVNFGTLVCNHYAVVRACPTYSGSLAMAQAQASWMVSSGGGVCFLACCPTSKTSVLKVCTQGDGNNNHPCPTSGCYHRCTLDDSQSAA